MDISGFYTLHAAKIHKVQFIPVYLCACGCALISCIKVSSLYHYIRNRNEMKATLGWIEINLVTLYAVATICYDAIKCGVIGATQ